MTRAMRQLYFTHAEQRRLHGTDTYNAPSRFISEVPPELLVEVRPRIRVSQQPALGASGGAFARSGGAGAGLGAGLRGGGSLGEVLGDGMRLGSRVRHGKFGEGVVLTIEGQGAHARVQVNFERQGSKWLMLQYANLEVV
jgi:DNA helicase-2/ATP-dependent DNA helicase PcrA